MFPYFILEVITIEEIKVLELFGGIGAIRKAFIRQKIPHRIIDYVEVDKIRAIYQKRPGKTSSILYKQAGNSIVVNVLEAILNEIYRR